MNILYNLFFLFHAKVFEVKMFSKLNYLFLGCPNDHTLLSLIHLNTPYTHTHKIWVAGLYLIQRFLECRLFSYFPF